MTTAGNGSYYDLDDILSQEELIPCTTLFDFSHLGFLDPSTGDDYLAKGSRVDVPLWAVERWAMKNYVSISSFPKHYGQRARDRLLAEPVQVNLRERSTHGQFYSTGRKLLGLLDGHVEQVRKVLAASRRSRADNQRVAQLDRTQKQSQALRQTLLSTYTGDRLRCTLNWALGHDDHHEGLSRLDDLEANLFREGARASLNHSRWKSLGGQRRLPQDYRRPAKRSRQE